MIFESFVTYHGPVGGRQAHIRPLDGPFQFNISKQTERQTLKVRTAGFRSAPDPKIPQSASWQSKLPQVCWTARIAAFQSRATKRRSKVLQGGTSILSMAAAGRRPASATQDIRKASAMKLWMTKTICSPTDPADAAPASRHEQFP